MKFVLDKKADWIMMIILISSVGLNIVGDLDWTYAVSFFIFLVWAFTKYYYLKRKVFLVVGLFTIIALLTFVVAAASGWS